MDRILFFDVTPLWIIQPVLKLYIKYQDTRPDPLGEVTLYSGRLVKSLLVSLPHYSPVLGSKFNRLHRLIAKLLNALSG